MKKLILLLITVFLLTNTGATGQVSNYTFSQSVQSYGFPNTGAYIGTRIQDDEVNTAVLPFGFVYNGSTYTSVNVCSNGYLSFNTLTGSEYSAISDMASTNVIAPFAQDLVMATVIKGDLTSGSNTITNVSSLVNLSVGDTLIDLFFDFGGSNPVITGMWSDTITVSLNSNNTVPNEDLFFQNGSVRQQVTGTTPNRVCEFEYRNMTRFPVYDESINFKVRLYETSNKIEFLYGPMIAGVANSPSEVGLKGSNNADYNSRSVNSSNTWSTSVSTTFLADVCDFSQGLVPDHGLSYMWSPTVCVTPTLNVSTSNFAICAGQTATLTASGAPTFSWSNGATGPNISVSPSVTTTYSVLGSDGACSSTFAIVQQVSLQPTLTVVQSKTHICTGETATLTASGATTYSWSNGGTGAFTSVSPTASTAYSVFGSDGACTSSLVVMQFVIPQPTLTVTQSKTIICKGETATLTVSGAGIFLWSNGYNGTSLVVNPTVTTTYTVEGSNSDCVSKKVVSVNVNNCVGIDEMSAGVASINAYPNPFSGALQIQNPFQGRATLRLLDMLGNTVYQSDIEGLELHRINAEYLKKGLYVLILEHAGDRLAKKVIKN